MYKGVKNKISDLEQATTISCHVVMYPVGLSSATASVKIVRYRYLFWIIK